jgi:hypothetical protein
MSILVCKQKPCQEKEIVEKVVVKVFQGIGFASFHTASFTFVANISSEAHRGQSFSHFVLGNHSDLMIEKDVLVEPGPRVIHRAIPSSLLGG